jgi:hypothetical protein
LSNEPEIQELIPTDVEGLYRDSGSGAIVRETPLELQEYRARRIRLNVNQAKIDDINRIEDEMTEMKTQMAALTEMLKTALAVKE